MKDIKAIAAVAMLLGLSLLLSGCPGTLGPGCCPKIKAFKVDDPWVCPANCPGGGKTRINYEIEFWRENERCEPPRKLKISIKNVTDNIDLPPLIWNNPKLGIYTGVEQVRLTKDTEYKLTVKTEEVTCVEASGSLNVNVVDKGDFHEICFSGSLDWPNCTHNGGFVPFGPGVLVDRTNNPSLYGVLVTKDSKSEFVKPYKDGWAFSGSDAAGSWSIGLTSQTDCNSYASLPKEKQSLCVNAYLKCVCP